MPHRRIGVVEAENLVGLSVGGDLVKLMEPDVAWYAGKSLIEASGRLDDELGVSKGATIDEVVEAHIKRTLVEHHGNKTHAAKALGVCTKTLYNYAHKYGMMSLVILLLWIVPSHAQESTLTPETRAIHHGKYVWKIVGEDAWRITDNPPRFLFDGSVAEVEEEDDHDDDHRDEEDVPEPPEPEPTEPQPDPESPDQSGQEGDAEEGPGEMEDDSEEDTKDPPGAKPGSVLTPDHRELIEYVIRSLERNLERTREKKERTRGKEVRSLERNVERLKGLLEDVE